MRIAVLAVVAPTMALLTGLLKRRADRTTRLELDRERNYSNLLVSSMQDGLIARDADGRILQVNQRFCDMTGFAREELLGRQSPYPFWPEEHVVHLRQAYDQFISGQAADHDLVFKRKNGQRFPIILSAGPAVARSGKSRILVTTVKDVTDRQWQQRKLTAQYAATRVLAESTSLEQAVPQILEAICQSLGWMYGAVWLINPGEQRLRCAHTWHQQKENVWEFERASRQIQFTNGIGLPGRVWENGKPAWISDVVHDPNFPRAQAAAKQGLHGAFGFPIRASNQVIGVMEFFSPEIHLPDEELLSMVGTISSQIGQFISRTRAEASVCDSEVRKSAILEAALDCIITMDHHGRVVEFNPVAERTFGFKQADVAGRELAELIIPPALREQHRRGLAHYLATGEGPVMGRRIEITGIRADGNEVPVELAITRIDVAGEPMFTAYLRDITDRKRAEEALRQRASELAQSARALRRTNEELDQFAYVTSHDLKAPLRGIANLSRWMEEDLADRVPPEARKQMELLRGRVARMEGLIDGILEYSRAGRLSGKFEEVNVATLLAEVVDLLSPPDPFVIEVQAGMPTLGADRLRLQQVFMNLIGNAVKHHGGRSGLVRVSCRDAEEFYEFCVADDGRGIAPEYHEKIFIIFQTLAPRDKVEGTGVGLSLVKKIVENLGGSVRVESALGAGARFYFTWPKDMK